MRALCVLGLFVFGVWAGPPSSPTATGPLPLETVDSRTADTIQKMRDRRIETIASVVEDSYPFAHPRDISSWLSTLDATGKWPGSEIDYTSGCKAQRANWPAGNHWHRLVVMTAAWQDSIPDSIAEDAYKWGANKTLRASIDRAMNWWFQNDFKTAACIDGGGYPQCPCNTEGLWNVNWFTSAIYIPRLISRVCSFLAVGDSITLTTTNACAGPMIRAFALFKQPYVVGLGPLTGANAIDLAAIGIDAALLTANTALLSDAYNRIHQELVLKHNVGQDGVRTDGSFAQHGGLLLYAGNYGKDFINAVVAVENAAVGTQWSANDEQKKVLGALLDADRWMIYRNIQTGVLHWDFSALNRFITFPVADGQATANLHLNLTQIGQLGAAWNMDTISTFAQSLQTESINANAGGLVGNKVFWANDYLVHRGSNYVMSLKMYSKRTQNSECINKQNPYGLHLSDGTMYTYQSGAEYEDIAAAWDWSLVPGTTLYPGAAKLECGATAFNGKESFVGGVSDGKSGLATMEYRSPEDDQLMWQKAWFFLPGDVQVVMVSQLAPGRQAISVLDQKKWNGDVVMDDRVLGGGEQRMGGVSTLWHDNVGYSLKLSQESGSNLVVRTESKTGDWAKIGTSKQPGTTINLFTAFIEHKDQDFVYAMFPGVDRAAFASKVVETNFQVIQNDGIASVLHYPATHQLFVVFWASGKLNPVSLSGVKEKLSVGANASVAFVYDIANDQLNVADPSQELQYVEITLALPGSPAKAFTIQLPEGGRRGSSIVQSVAKFVTIQDNGTIEASTPSFIIWTLLCLFFVQSFELFL